MQIELTATLEAFVEQRVRSGRYQDASEVLREALRLLERRERAWEPEIDQLEEKLLAGLDSAKHPVADDFFDGVRRRGMQRLDPAPQAR